MTASFKYKLPHDDTRDSMIENSVMIKAANLTRVRPTSAATYLHDDIPALPLTVQDLTIYLGKAKG